MNISLRDELEKFVHRKVQAGEYACADEVFEAGLARLVDDELDEQTWAAIDEGEAQLDRGEGMAMEEAFRELRQRHLKQ